MNGGYVRVDKEVYNGDLSFVLMKRLTQASKSWKGMDLKR